MTLKKFEYESEMKTINNVLNSIDISTTNGLKCAWSCEPEKNRGLFGCDSTLHFSWYFNWDELKAKGIDRFTGHITVRPLVRKYFAEETINVDLNESDQIVEKSIYAKGGYNAMFEYFLTPHYTRIEEVKEESMFMFTPSQQNDAILVVEGKKIHVNKAFLSCHSEYFHTLFSSNHKEEQMNEISIGGISYNDFKLLLGTISPNTVFPTDETVETLLELATRFKVPFVIRHVEYYLLHMSKIGNGKKMLIGEKYGMKKILAKSILEIDTIGKAKKWKQSPEYINFSLETKNRVFEQFF